VDDSTARIECLSGVRVLDLSRVLAGPWAAQTLGDLGAEVIKIERPGAGDETRSWGPPFLRDKSGQETAESAYYLSANRNKRSVTIDFTTQKGRDLVRALACKSDVLIENFKVGGLRRHGLDYESLKTLHPGLVYCSITGFGQTGPYAQRPGYDLLVQAMGGLMSVTGEPGGGPQKVGVAVTDIITGLYSAVGVLAALEHRRRTGRGQHLDMALMDCQVASLANQAMNFLTTGVSPGRLGNAHPNIVPYQDLPTLDGAMVVAVGNDAQFADFCGALGRPEWALDPRFTDNRGRLEHRQELISLICAITAQAPTAQWTQILERAGVPCGPVNTVAEALADPQVEARQMKVELPHPSAGLAPSLRCPIRLSETPARHTRAPPLLGEHTEEVLIEALGLTPSEIERLREEGVV